MRCSKYVLIMMDFVCFMNQLAVNQAVREADEEEDPDTSQEEEPVIPRARNRPKREAQASSAPETWKKEKYCCGKRYEMY